MADRTGIEWADATWNPITGCSLKSPGCINCYAMRLAGSRMRNHPSRAGLTQDTKAGPVWNGQVRLNEAWLDAPLRWRKPRRIFVCAHGDLFHEQVPDEWIARVFTVMCQAKRHSFQVLTKRADRMREFVSRCANAENLGWMTHNGAAPNGYGGDGIVVGGAKNWPLPNVWLGVSVEDQMRADERIPDLLATPAAIRWISAEPLLERVDIARYLFAQQARIWHSLASINECVIPAPNDLRFHWVVAGGESGPRARAMHPDWARSLRDQCEAAGVPFLFKQWGGRTPKAAGRMLDGVVHDAYPEAG